MIDKTLYYQVPNPYLQTMIRVTFMNALLFKDIIVPKMFVCLQCPNIIVNNYKLAQQLSLTYFPRLIIP